MVIVIYDSSYSYDPTLKKPDYYLPHYFSEDNTVFYVCLPRNIRGLRTGDIFNNMFPRLSKEAKNLYVINWPWWLAATYFNRIISNITSIIRRFCVKALVRSIKSSNGRVVEYYTHPSTFTFFKIFKDSTTVYHPYDVFSKYGVKDDEEQGEYEHNFMKKFNIVIVPHIAMREYYLNYD